MAGKLVFDNKTLKVTSAELDVNYAGQLAVIAKELGEIKNIDARVRRALGAIGVTALPLRDADLKKIGSQSNAAALIADFEKASIEITMTPIAWSDAPDNISKAEAASREELFNRAAKPLADRLVQIDREIAALQQAKKTLVERKDGMLAEIKALTQGPRADFDRKLKDLRQAAEVIRVPYQRGGFNVDGARKYIKKK